MAPRTLLLNLPADFWSKHRNALQMEHGGNAFPRCYALIVSAWDSALHNVRALAAD
jgi:hypothetical protein